MKKLLVFLCAMLLVFGSVSISHAAPFLYTFTGTVSSTFAMQDTAGLIAAAGIEAGDPVEYTFLIDLEADGYFVLYNGDVVDKVDSLPSTDYFFTDWISGSYMGNDGIGQKADGDVAEYNYGLNQPSSNGYAQGGSYDDRQAVFTTTGSWNNLGIGSLVHILEESYDEARVNSYFWVEAHVTSIEPTSVPDASVMLLLGSSLMGLAVFSRKTE